MILKNKNLPLRGLMFHKHMDEKHFSALNNYQKLKIGIKRMIDKKLRQEVIDLYNNLFTWQIDQVEKNVSTAVMTGIIGFYMDMGGSPLETAIYAGKCMEKMNDENMKLYICKSLLEGEKVLIPGMRGEFCLWGIYYDLRTGEKYKDEAENN
jgi:hypothetical protein